MTYTTEELPSIDIRELARLGLFVAGVSLNVRSRMLGAFSIAGDGAGAKIHGDGWSQHIQITQTPCHLGGDRPWFVCPGCNERAAILYSARSFACRKCHGIYYECQRTRGRHSALGKLQRIRQRLGGSANLSEPFPSRPARMWRRTYDRMRDDAERLEHKYLNSMSRAHQWQAT